MFNRTAEYLAHGARSLGSNLAKLQPEQRRRVEKSSEKIGKVLGEMPIVDIISSSPRAVDGIMSEARELKQGKKGGKSKKKGSSPPALRLKLTPLRHKSTRLVPGTPRTTRTSNAHASCRSLKFVPGFDLVEPVSHVEVDLLPAVPMSETSTPQDTLFLSPLSPMSSFSQIETSNSLEQRYQELRQLACVSRGFHSTVVEEIPSVEQIKKVSSYLDLYRITNQSRRDVDATSAVTHLNPTYTAYTDATHPEDVYTAYIACTPVPAHHRRRSVSFSQVLRPSMLSNGVITPIPRASFVVPHSASVYSFEDQPGRYTLMIKIPSPFTPSFSSSTANSTGMSRSRTFVLDTPQTAKPDTLLETPGDDSCPLQQQQKEARVRAVLEAMGDSAPPASTPHAPAPQIPAQTLRGPYWVRQSYRISGQGSVRRRRSSTRVPPTPRTVRRERRQGWGGEWKSGKLRAAVEELMEIKTPAPRVSRRLTNEEVPPVPMKDFIVIQ